MACLQQYHLASPGRLCPARWPSTNGEEVLPRPHGHSGTVWLARTGAVLHSGPAPVARRHYWNDPAMAAMSDQPLQAPAGVAAWRRWREGTPRTAQLRRHRTANPGRCQPVQRPGALGKGVCRVAWLWQHGLAGSSTCHPARQSRQRVGTAMVIRARAAPSGQPRQASSGAAAWRWQ